MVAKSSTNVNNTFTVLSDLSGQRLDKFLVEKIPDMTRSQIQKIIKSGGVLVNGKASSVHHFLKENDEIRILRAPSNDEAHKPAPERVAKAFMPSLQELKIIADTPDYLVINKPAGLLVHEAPGHNEPTLVDLVLKKYPAVAKIGEDPMRPGIMHRLDKEVSGLIVVAKTQDMFDHLKKQFQSRQTKKEYLALVYGTPQKNEGTITFNIDRSQTARYKMAAIPTSDSNEETRGRKAITEFEALEHLGNYTLLKVMPRTGRTHQIRVHLNAYGLPIVGDLVYKPKKLKNKINLRRIFLHANKLGFLDLKNVWQEFQSPLPDELQSFLSSLKPA